MIGGIEDDAHHELKEAERLRVRMRELLESAHERLRHVVDARVSSERVAARESQGRADTRREDASKAHRRGGAARDRSDAARDRADTAAASTGDRVTRGVRRRPDATARDHPPSP
jgi:hypothetical protein